MSIKGRAADCPFEAVVGGSVVEESVVGSVVLIVSGPVVLMDSVITVTGIHEISTIISDINQYALNKNFTVEDC